MDNELTIGKQNMVSLISDKPLEELIKPLKREILLFDSYVAGTAYVEDENFYTDLRKGDKLTLKREPANRYDERAILILDSKNRKLGYVPEKDNIVFARLMDAGKYLMAKVNKAENNASFWKISISIYLVDF